MAIITSAAAAVGLKKLFDELAASGTPAVKSFVKVLLAKHRIPRLYRKMVQVRKVKTIWQLDKEVDLFQFYYPSRLQVDATVVKATTLQDIPYDGSFIIEGTIGQGKSIYMRYLTANELTRGLSSYLY